MKCKCNNIEAVEVFYFTDVYESAEPVQDMNYAKEGDACVDIRANEDIKVYPLASAIIPTGLNVAIPVGYEMQVRPRSGLSAKTDLIFKNTIGTIDSGYREQLYVMWYNLGSSPIEFKRGDRIAQVKIEKVLPVKYTRVSTVDEIRNMGTNRGGGLGSSGIK